MRGISKVSFKIEDKQLSILSIVFFSLVVLSSITDIVTDIGQGANVKHIIQESLIAFFALLLLLVLFFNTKAEKIKNKQLQKNLEELTEISEQVSKELVNAKKIFGEEINKQFIAWQLTKSECDIALFTIKGFNSKEIAILRSVSEKTIRNQLTSIYRKAGLSGKQTFIAWFMDGLV